MSEPDYTSLVAGQRAYFLAGKTRPLEWRVEQLKALKAMFEENREELFEALRHDLRRNEWDSDLMDVAFCVREADYALEHLDDWVKPQRIHTPALFEPAHVRLRRDPLGTSLWSCCSRRWCRRWRPATRRY
jgi:aldehyde dehydrogenase (NAD+)